MQKLANKLEKFDFQPVDCVLFGQNRLEEAGEESRKLGFKRTLVVTDCGILQAGHVDKALQSLRRAGIEPFLFSGVEENPTTHHVQKALEVARQHAIDSIIGIGGGSSMDCAKGLNFILTNGGKMQDYMGIGKANKPMLPSLGIPTTAGTGSEAQSFALISDPVTRKKMACGDKKAAFKTVILDPMVTISMPHEVATATGMDAISHALESFVTNKRNPISQAFSRESWRLLSTNFPVVMETSEDLNARAAMLLGASLSGMAIEHSMLGATHALSNPLTARFGITHGVAISLLLPHVVRYNGTVCEADYQELAEISEKGSGSSGRETIASCIEYFRDLAGLPRRLSECGVPEECIPALAEEAAQQWTAQFNPRTVDSLELEALYKCAY